MSAAKNQGMSNPDTYVKKAPSVEEMAEFVIKTLGRPTEEQIATGNNKVLDLGCGAGRLSEYMKGIGWNVVSIDVNPKMVEASKARGVGAIQMDICDIGDKFKEGQFNYVISNAVLHWLSEDKLDKTLQGVNKLLNEGGQFIDSHASEKGAQYLLNAMKHAFGKSGIEFKSPWTLLSAGEFEEHLQKSGFVIENGNVRIKEFELKLMEGAKGWVETFAPNFADRELSPEEIKRISQDAGEYYKEHREKDIGSNKAVYPRFMIHTTPQEAAHCL